MQNKFSKKLLMFSLLALVATPATQAEPLQDITIAFSSLSALLGVSYVGFRACSWTGRKIRNKLGEFKKRMRSESIKRINDAALEAVSKTKEVEIKQENPDIERAALDEQVTQYLTTTDAESAIDEKRIEIVDALKEIKNNRYWPKIKNKTTKFFNALPIPKVTTINNILKYGTIAAALTTVVACIKDPSIRTVIHA